jgi:ATP synthase subunit 6
MPQLDFTVWSVSVLFTIAAIFIGISAYHLDSENDFELGYLQIKSFKFGLVILSPLDQFGDSLFWVFGTLLLSTLVIENVFDGLFGRNSLTGDEIFSEILDTVGRGPANIDLDTDPNASTFVGIAAANVAGLLPYVETSTASVAATFTAAFSMFAGINIIAFAIKKVPLSSHALPSGIPLAIGPFLIIIEIVSYMARGLSLGIRLFANMTAGHALLKILASFTWSFTRVLGLSLIIFVPWAAVAVVTGLEIVIALLQAYVFATLSAIYLDDVLSSSH